MRRLPSSCSALFDRERTDILGDRERLIMVYVVGWELLTRGGSC